MAQLTPDQIQNLIAIDDAINVGGDNCRPRLLRQITSGTKEVIPTMIAQLNDKYCLVERLLDYDNGSKGFTYVVRPDGKVVTLNLTNDEHNQAEKDNIWISIEQSQIMFKTFMNNT